jgi:hypothetical protein
MNISIVGAGFIGTALHNQINNSVLFGRNDTILNEHEILVIAAPTGNRLVVNSNSNEDIENCNNIIQLVKNCKYQQLVLISTVDTYATYKSYNADIGVVQPTAKYGANRWYLENELSKLPNSKIARLCSISDVTLKKNTLFDLKTQSWLGKINSHSLLQWYPLKRLSTDIITLIESPLKYQNFVSTPILNKDIIQKFCPTLVDQISKNNIAPVVYNVRDSNQNYSIPLDEVWKSFEEYFI